jgi:RNA polymerase sigma factor (sigma-70 family)
MQKDPGSASAKEEAFRRVVAEHRTPIFQLAHRTLHSREGAEDIVQSVLLTLWAELEFRNGEWFYRDSIIKSLKHWINTVALRAAISARRALKRTSGLGDAPEPPSSGVSQYDAFLLEELARLVSELPEALREAFILHYCHGLSGSEIAERTQTSEHSHRRRWTEARLRVLARAADESERVDGPDNC